MFSRPLFDDSEFGVFRETIRKFVAAEVTPSYRSWEEEGIVPRSVWRSAGEIGLLCPMTPERYGGIEGDFRHSTLVIEEMARAGAVAPTFFLQSDVVAPYINHFGSEEQKERWLPKMVTGEVVTAVGMTEPSGGSDLKQLKTKAVREGNDYVINGQKVFITNGHSADLLLLACRTNDSPGARGVSLLLVEMERDGVHRGRRLSKIGCKAQDTAELFFDNVRVPAGHMLGEEGKGFRYLMTELVQERLVMAVRAVASSEAALDWTIEYAKNRRMFGTNLGAMQNTQFTLAQLHSEVLAQRVFIDECIRRHCAGELDSLDAAKAKLITTQLQGRVMDECLQLFGGWGYMTEYPIARAFVDARMTRIGGGTSEIMKQIIGKSLFAEL